MALFVHLNETAVNVCLFLKQINGNEGLSSLLQICMNEENWWTYLLYCHYRQNHQQLMWVWAKVRDFKATLILLSTLTAWNDTLGNNLHFNKSYSTKYNVLKMNVFVDPQIILDLQYFSYCLWFISWKKCILTLCLFVCLFVLAKCLNTRKPHHFHV